MNYLLKYLLNEVTADEKFDRQYKGKMDREIFNQVLELDPTTRGPQKVGKYVDWIIRNDITDTSVSEYLEKFEKYKAKIDPSKRDINKLNFNDLVSIIDELEKSGELVSKKDKKSAERLKAEKESKVVYSSDRYIIIVPETEEASQFWGAGADWCTARRESMYCMFDHYNRTGTLYIVINKKTKEKHQMWKSNNNKKYEFRDLKNNEFDPWETFYDDLLEWMEENDFPRPGILTDEQSSDLADQFLNLIEYDLDDTFADAHDIVKQYWDSYNENDYGNLDLYQYISQNDVGELAYIFEEAMNKLETKYGIKKDSNKNKLNLLPYLSMDIKYEIDYNDFNDVLERFSDDDWDMTYDESVESMVDRFFDEHEDTLDNVIQYIELWLSKNYHSNFKQFETFYDDFIDEWEKWIGKLTDDEKAQLKSLVDKVKKVEYGKSDHPKLELNSVQYRAVKYL